MVFKKSQVNVGLLTFPLSKSGLTPLSNLVDVTLPNSKELVLITGNAGYEYYKDDKRFRTYNVDHKVKKNILSRSFAYILTQLKFSNKIMQNKNTDIWIFFIGTELFVIGMLVAKFQRKDVFLLFAGSILKTLKSKNDNYYLIAKFLLWINCELSDKIIVFSEEIINDLKIQRYKKKIIIAHNHFINLDKFRIIKKYDERDNLIGYIGRLVIEKGVMNFIESIQLFDKTEQDLKFLLCGDGDLKDQIKDYLEKNNLTKRVMFLDEVNHDKIPIYLNKLKLLVIPSFTEGLPNILIEAMACGTPVLATPVGAIPDLIIDNKTGFLLKENSPYCIKKNIIRAIKVQMIK